jgi:amino-acid N-acetyltransferase
MNFRSAKIADIEDIAELLNTSNLPSDDFTEHLDNFIVSEEAQTIVGVGGLETHGPNGLVRSLAVKPKHQRKGIGKLIYKSIENKAGEIGLSSLYLLTESAEAYFTKLGFIVKDRSYVPVSIANTKQFKLFCPTTATVMVKELDGHAIQKSL